MTSEDIKHQLIIIIFWRERAQELCESRGGRHFFFHVALRPRRRDGQLGTGTEWEGDERVKGSTAETGETVDRRQNNGSVKIKAVSPRGVALWMGQCDPSSGPTRSPISTNQRREMLLFLARIFGSQAGITNNGSAHTDSMRFCRFWTAPQ